MKKVVSMVLLATLAYAPAVYAAKKDKEKEAGKPSASVAEMRKKVETLKTDLNGSSWEILLSPGGKGKEAKDELVFQNNQVSLKDFSGKGFKPTNYTITPPPAEGGPAIWETMQTSDKDGLLFIRGEWKEKEQIMRGVISHQKEGGPAQDYNFSSQAKVTIEPVTKEKQDEEAKAAAVAAPAAVQEEVLVSKEAENKPTKN
jgi:hypothetical protein